MTKTKIALLKIPVFLILEITSDELCEFNNGPPLTNMVAGATTVLPFSPSVVDIAGGD